MELDEELSVVVTVVVVAVVEVVVIGSVVVVTVVVVEVVIVEVVVVVVVVVLVVLAIVVVVLVVVVVATFVERNSSSKLNKSSRNGKSCVDPVCSVEDDPDVVDEDTDDVVVDSAAAVDTLDVVELNSWSIVNQVNSWLFPCCCGCDVVELSWGLKRSGLMDKDSRDTTDPSPRMIEGILLSISKGTSIESRRLALSSSS